MALPTVSVHLKSDRQPNGKYLGWSVVIWQRPGASDVIRVVRCDGEFESDEGAQYGAAAALDKLIAHPAM